LFNALVLAVAIIAHEPGYYTSLANHLHRWLASENIVSSVTTPARMAAVLKSERMAFLVGFASPSPSEMNVLGDFTRRGGKLVVFHSASPALGALMGVRPVGYSAAPYPGAWSRMSFNTKMLSGAPASIRQSSSVLQRARPIEGRSRILATWSDRAGKSTSEPAWLASSTGYWMTHVLLADGDEDLKAQLLGALVGSFNPKAWSIASHNSRVAAKTSVLRSYAAQQVPRRGEIHATWDHSGCGLYPGNWPRTMRVLKEARVSDLFVNVAGFSFAHYPSQVLPRSKTFAQEGDQLAACLAAAKGTGIRVHPWIVCFSATRGTPEYLQTLAKRGWRLKTSKGALTDYVDPSNPAVRRQVIAAIEEIRARYPSIAGIHLDFVRWGDTAVKPKNAPDVIFSFVTEARRTVRRPHWLTAAVYGRYPTCVRSVGQDWYGWLDAGIVDYLVPMDYVQSKTDFLALLATQAVPRSHAHRTIVGIGVTANESRLDARQVIDQINMTRTFGFAGVALFDLDTQLEKAILPYLRLGLW